MPRFRSRHFFSGSPFVSFSVYPSRHSFAFPIPRRSSARADSSLWATASHWGAPLSSLPTVGRNRDSELDQTSDDPPSATSFLGEINSSARKKPHVRSTTP